MQAEVLAYKQEKLTASGVFGPVFWLAVGLAVAPAFILMSSLHTLLDSLQVTEKLSLFQTFHWPVTNRVHKKMYCGWCFGWFHVTFGWMCVNATFFGSLCERERDTKRDVAVISAQQWWRWFRERAFVTFSLHSWLVFLRLQSRQCEHLVLNINTVVILRKHTCISHSRMRPSGQQYQMQFCWLIKWEIPHEMHMARSLWTLRESGKLSRRWMSITSYQNTISDLYPSDEGLLSSGSTWCSRCWAWSGGEHAVDTKYFVIWCPLLYSLRNTCRAKPQKAGTLHHYWSPFGSRS